MAPKVEVFEEIDWSPKPTLRPGMDFHAGTTYFTIPLTRNVIKTVGKGDKAREETSKELQTYVITSHHEGMWYDKETLDIEGFVPSEQVYQERTTRWSSESAKAWLDDSASPKTATDLFAAVRKAYTTYVDYADETFHDLMALYVIYTYVFRLFETTGYIHFNGTAASGKSRNLALLSALAFNTVWASSMSAASLYRKLSGSPGTSCIDETEGFDGERGEELRRILNAGLSRRQQGRPHREVGQGPLHSHRVRGLSDPRRWRPSTRSNPSSPAAASSSAMRPAIRELPDFEVSDPQWQRLRDDLYVWATGQRSRHSMNCRTSGASAARWRSLRNSSVASGRPAASSSCSPTTSAARSSRAASSTFFNEYFAKQQEALNATDRLRTTLRALPRVLANKAAHPGNLYSAKDIHEVISGYLEEDAKEYFKTKHVIKNLDTIGFRTKQRAAGGLRVLLLEDDIRNEFHQRRVDPFPEDTEWLEGKVDLPERQGQDRRGRR